MQDIATVANSLQAGDSLTVTISRSSSGTANTPARHNNRAIDAYYEDMPDDYVTGQYIEEQKQTELNTVIIAALVFLLAAGFALVALIDYISAVSMQLAEAGALAIVVASVLSAATIYSLVFIYKLIKR